MTATLKLLRTVWAGFLVAFLLYVYLPEAMHLQPKAEPALFYNAIVGVNIAIVVVIFIVRKRMTTPAEAILANDSENKESLTRLRKGYVLIFALSEASVLFGLNLRFMGFTRVQVAPFYIVGGILLLYCFPRNLSSQASLQ